MTTDTRELVERLTNWANSDMEQLTRDAKSALTAQAQEIAELRERNKKLEDQALEDYSLLLNWAHEFGAKNGDDMRSVITNGIAELREKVERLRQALEWYGSMAKRMGNAAIAQDNQAILTLMKDIAVDYGGRAKSAQIDRAIEGAKP